MATHDYVIANQSGAAFRTDLNNALAAIVSNNSNSSEPATKYAYQWWADTSASIFKIRNSSNDGWINLFTLAGGIDVDAASNFNEDVTFTTNNGNNIVFDKSDNRFLFNDSTNATFGTGADLKIFHDGTDSFIDNATGGLKLLGDTIRLKSKSVDENMVVASVNGAVELFYDNGARLQTTSAGVNFSGNLSSDSGGSFTINAGGASGTAAHFIARCASENAIVAVPNGAVELYHDNVKSIETTSEGCTIQKDGSSVNAILFIKSTNGGQAKLQLEAGGNQGGGVSRAARIDFVNTEVSTSSLWTLINDYQQNGTNDFSIRHGAEEAITANPDGAVELFFDNVKQIETTTLGANIRDHHKFMTGTVTQRVFQSSTGICIRPNVGGSGSSNTQGTFIRASANCSNIDDDNTVKFVVFATGDVQNANNSYAGFSDVNLKQDIVDAGSQWDDIKNLKVRKYRFKNNPTGPLQIGCIAQEVETISAGLIETDPEEGFKSLKYSVLYMKAIKCLQEAQAKIETLETKVAALEAA